MKFNLNAMGDLKERTGLFRDAVEKLERCEHLELDHPQGCNLADETLVAAFQAARQFGFGATSKLAKISKGRLAAKPTVEEFIVRHFACIHSKGEAQAEYEERIQEAKEASGIPETSEGPLGAKHVPDFRYCRKAFNFWFKSAADGVYTPVVREVARQMLGEARISTETEDNGEPSPADKHLLKIIREKAFDLATPLAGYTDGLYHINGVDVLVTKGYGLIQPAAGDCRMIDAIFKGLLIESDETQSKVLPESQTEQYWCLLRHLQNCYKELAAGYRAGSLAVFLCGPTNIGKSVLLQLIATLLGGRMGNAYLYISGQSSFNDELMAKEIWIIDDGVPLSDYMARQRLAGLLKQATASSHVPCHGKGKAQATLPLYRRLFVALNPEDIETLPTLTEAVKDKYMLLKVKRFEMPDGMPKLPQRHEQPAFMAQLVKEMPAFIEWLLRQDLSGYNDRRFGVVAYQNAELVSANVEASGLDAKYAVLENVLFHESTSSPDALELKASEIFIKLNSGLHSTRLTDMFRNPRTLGFALSELADSDSHKHLVSRRMLKGYNRWTIRRQGVEKVDEGGFKNYGIHHDEDIGNTG